MIAGVHDKQVPPRSGAGAVRRPRRDRQGARRSRLLLAQRDVGEQPPLLFDASLEWLATGAIVQESGVIRLGY